MEYHSAAAIRRLVGIRIAAMAAIAVIYLAACGGSSAQERRMTGRPIPVILDTDIGDDIDDTWALVMLLKSPRFDLKLVTTTNGKAEYRARLAAKLLEAAGRSDVPVGMGAGGTTDTGPQADWVGDYKLDAYPGKVHEDGVQALIDCVKGLAAKKVTPTIIALGPLHTLDAALGRDPGIAPLARFSGMHGSVRKGYDGNPTPCVEWNMTYVPGARKVLSAPWKSASITPLDTCGLVRLKGEQYRRVAESTDPMVQVLIENYRIWAKKGSASDLTESSVLFDTVAVYLADPGPKPLLGLEKLNILVDEKGMMSIDPAGAVLEVAATWKDLAGYEKHLVDVLLGPLAKGGK